MATVSVGRGENPTPTRTTEQRRVALAHANAIRLSRAELKRELRADQTRIADVIAAPPDWLLTAKVYELMLAVPHFGRTRTGRLLNRHTISFVKTVGGLSSRQRQALVADLRMAARRYER